MKYAKLFAHLTNLFIVLWLAISVATHEVNTTLLVLMIVALLANCCYLWVLYHMDDR